MQDRDWTGTAAAVTALVMTAGVWLWPQTEGTPHTAAVAADEPARAEMAHWRAEARRWDGTADTVQLSSAEPAGPLLR